MSTVVGELRARVPVCAGATTGTGVFTIALGVSRAAGGVGTAAATTATGITRIGSRGAGSGIVGRVSALAAAATGRLAGNWFACVERLAMDSAPAVRINRLSTIQIAGLFDRDVSGFARTVSTINTVSGRVRGAGGGTGFTGGREPAPLPEGPWTVRSRNLR